jgi:hypothetical protein
MIDASQDFFYSRLDVAKIHAYSKGIELSAPDEYFDQPVVPVDVCTVAGVTSQAVSRGKVVLYVNLKYSRHRLSDLKPRSAPLSNPNQSNSHTFDEYIPAFPKLKQLYGRSGMEGGYRIWGTGHGVFCARHAAVVRPPHCGISDYAYVLTGLRIG